jgi:hypothetical protein
MKLKTLLFTLLLSVQLVAQAAPPVAADQGQPNSGQALEPGVQSSTLVRIQALGME